MAKKKTYTVTYLLHYNGTRQIEAVSADAAAKTVKKWIAKDPAEALWGAGASIDTDVIDVIETIGTPGLPAKKTKRGT